jgi:SAM-dependent methyltransferase
MSQMDDLRRYAPATMRNRDPIMDVLRQHLPASGMVLEVASGTGEHIVYFARHFPHLRWQPSDPSIEALRSIAAWIDAEGLTNVQPPLHLDAAQFPWPVQQAAAIACINMIHISPWEATVGIMRQAGGVLPKGGLLFLYGPFRRAERPLEPSNAAFDQDLRVRNPRWGLRELDVVIATAAENGLTFTGSVEMPANNLSVIFRNG